MRFTRATALRSLAAAALAFGVGVAALPAFAAKPAPATILDLAAQQKNLSTFVAAVKAAGLESELTAAGPLTVFAPTDEAFKKLPAGKLDALMAPAGRDELRALLLNHVVRDAVRIRENGGAATSGALECAGGAKLTFGGTEDRPTVDGAGYGAIDMQARNGLLDTVDRVLLPS